MRRAGLDARVLPASTKPFAPILIGSSFGREIATERDATDAMSSRTTSRPCAGTLKRIIRPASSVQMSAGSAAPGKASVNCVRVARITRAVVWICCARMPTRTPNDTAARRRPECRCLRPRA